MPWTQLSFEDESVFRIRSHYSTLSRYIQTSKAAHGYLPVSASHLASALGKQVEGIEQANPESKLVNRWATKFRELVHQHDLDAPPVSD